MPKKIKRAMLLAAGKGERMRPLTDKTPKPLLQVGNTALIENNLVKLQKAGIEEVVINLCYLGDQIKNHCGDGSNYGLKIFYSAEPNGPLGAGGGIVKALPLLGDEHFILMAADIWSDFPLETLLNKTDRLAHLVMVNNPDFHKQGDFGVQNNKLTYDGPSYTYSSISVWSPKTFQPLNLNHHQSLIPFIQHAIDCKQASAEIFTGFWENLGTPEQLAALNQQISA